MRAMVRNGVSLLVATALALPLAVASANAADVVVKNDLAVTCGKAPPGHPVKGRRDYTLMSTNEKDRRDIRYHEYFHIEPARKQLATGNLSWGVMNNLHFVLHKVPNDHPALQLLVQWDKAGGRDPAYASPACYLVWASEFAPNDPMVWGYGGVYFYNKGDKAMAGQWWNKALALNPNNADVHYNLGLLQFEQGDYAAARKHAEAAYAAGYPLPGLRDKLRKAGQWPETPQAGQ